MKPIHWNRDEHVAMVTMDNGENRHNLEFVRAMLGILDDIEADPDLRALVLASSHEKYWSLGADVDGMFGPAATGGSEAVRRFLYELNDLFKRLLTFPLPVIASINGHVVANGLVLAAACDFRLMRTDRGLVRFPEIDLGIPFLPGMIAITRKILPNPFFEEMKYTAGKYTAADLERRAALTRTFTGPEALRQGTLEFARAFNKGRGIMGEMKRRMNRDIIRILDEVDPGYIETAELKISP